jgi:23S rRNA A2030 N6-methylase RlmJ
MKGKKKSRIITKMYMNINTGSVDSKDGWEDFENNLKDGSLREVIWLEPDFDDQEGQWIEVI